MNSPYTVSDSFSLIKKLNDIFKVNEHQKLVSFTPINIALDYINENFTKINTALPTEIFIQAIKLFSQFSFSFQYKFYSEIFGCLMGSYSSPIICDILVFKLKSEELNNLTFEISLYT